MSKSNQTENDLMEYIFKSTAIPWSAAGNWFISLHTADPGDAGNQTTSEATYGGYARIQVVRSGAGWTVSGNQAQNAALVQFPQCTSGSSIATHVAIGTSLTGTGQILYSGALSGALSISTGIQPQFSPGTLVVTED